MKIFFTITGTDHHYGKAFFEKGMKVRLEKEPDNEYDTEAIKVMLKGMGCVGYVANSPYTVIGESWSAGRVYDKIGDIAHAKVLYVVDKSAKGPSGVLCVLDTKKQHSGPDNGGKHPKQDWEDDIIPPTDAGNIILPDDVLPDEDELG